MSEPSPEITLTYIDQLNDWTRRAHEGQPADSPEVLNMRAEYMKARRALNRQLRAFDHPDDREWFKKGNPDDVWVPSLEGF